MCGSDERYSLNIHAFLTVHKPTHQSGFRWLTLISRTWAETIYRFPSEKSKNGCSFSEIVLFPWYIDLEVICSRGHYYKLKELWGTIRLYMRVRIFLYKATEVQRLTEYNSITYRIGNANTITSFFFFYFLVQSSIGKVGLLVMLTGQMLPRLDTGI